ncbi:hypothetical protein [Brevibacterium sp. ZH18]|uniref:hypothetical protein n=1 Tax=Brevibacterium sp. ZH18 TaxID=2927784 RepID=UPI001F60DE79|nr:hypothetical protein [Brevibacterium sp. ZH18]MCI4013147.1 hypothetical protein [Brevibacterium sp. ZH18]
MAENNRPVDDDYRMGGNRPVADDPRAPRAPEGDPRVADGQGQRDGFVDGRDPRDPRAAENDPRLADPNYDPRAAGDRNFEDPDTPRH